jgi:3-hydroxyacyl-CoA dehydrogenase/enoyl-CoA hydratase/carnithine racemase
VAIESGHQHEGPSIHVSEHGGRRFGFVDLTDLEALAAAFETVADIDAIVLAGSASDLSPRRLAATTLRTIADRRQARELFQLGGDVVRRVADSDVPTIAFLDGDTYGEALELALHCTYRVAGEGVALALPQCALGLVPAMGGCHVVPSMIGARAAVDLIVRNPLSNNKATKVDRALSIGLIDAVVPHDDFREHALRWAADVLDGTVEVSRPEVDRGEAWNDAIDRARSWVDNRVRGGAPAPYRALDLIARAKTAAADEMYAGAADAAADLVMTEQMRASAYAHELMASRAPQPNAKPPAGLRTVGIVGAGSMAGQLAAHALRTLQLPVVVVPRNEVGVTRVRDHVAKVLTRSGDTHLLGRLTVTTDRAQLAEAGVVLEAVVENADVKQRVLSEVASVVGSECIIATGTSSLSVSELAQSLPHPERVVGLHFFNPVDMLPLLEVVHTEHTTEAVREAADGFGRALGKVVIDVADKPAFVFNRLIVRLFGEVLRLAEEGTPLPVAEAALAPLGLPMSPTQLIVFTSLPLITTIAERMYDAFPARFPKPNSLQALVQAGKDAFYIHQDGQRVVDPEIYALADRPEQLIERTADEVRDLALDALAEEIAVMLHDGVVTDVQDIDLAMLIGGNYPAYLGGITPYLDREGVSARVNGVRFLPPGVASLT